jgi:hypothetical protein
VAGRIGISNASDCRANAGCAAPTKSTECECAWLSVSVNGWGQCECVASGESPLLIAEQLGSPTCQRPYSQTSASLPRSARTLNLNVSFNNHRTPKHSLLLSTTTPIGPAPLIVLSIQFIYSSSLPAVGCATEYRAGSFNRERL